MTEEHRGSSGHPLDTTPTKVLYIGGTGRTGSTLLTRLLGQMPAWFAAGELAFLWRFGLGENGRCSCGARLRACPVWSTTLDVVAESGHTVDPERMVALRRRCWSIHLPALASSRISQRLLDRLEEYPTVVEATYDALASVTGAAVIVDSSKEPHYSWILRERTSLDVRFLHLVRDPRAVSASWRRLRREYGFDPDVKMETRGPAKVSLYYDVSNIAAEVIWGYSPRARFMRYEDFVQAPNAALRAIAEFMDEPAPSTPLVTNGRFEPDAGHIAWGNPNRFEAGAIDIRADDSWRKELPAMARLAVGVGTTGVAHRYGYRLTGSPDPLRRPTRSRGQVMIPDPIETIQ